MNKPCNFDTEVGSSAQSDCINLCEDTGCDTSLLGNSECNSECNNDECAWDFGDCAYCAQGCTEVMLGDGMCDDECYQPACGYDSGDCVSFI